jgi:hypothetical protein
MGDILMKVTFDYGKNNKGQQIRGSITNVKSKITIEMEDYQKMYDKLELSVEESLKDTDYNSANSIIDNILEIIAEHDVIIDECKDK